MLSICKLCCGSRAKLTEEKFLADPFNVGEKMYRTGDLARWLPDGNLEFLGRIDHQVKIRGFRIELGEIENRLLKHEFIRECVVITKEDNRGNKYLCAYLVADNKLTVSELREYCSLELPDYMVPSYFVQLEKLPLTPNGKIDRKTLPEPEGNIQTGVEYIAPSNETEAKLVSIWQQTLGIEKVGIHDNFFDLGGHSLKVLTLTMSVYEQFGVDFPISEVLNSPSIKQMARYISNIDEKKPSQSIMLLNVPKENNLFAFPPVVAYGLAYLQTAPLFENHSFYAFDFVEEDSRILDYIKLITSVQPQSPYTLVGHCAGGNLSFEIAKELNKQGYEVSNLIFLDTTRKIECQILKEEDVKKIGDDYGRKLMEKIGDVNTFQGKLDSVCKKIKNYVDYWYRSVNEKTVNANIHLIFADDQPNCKQMADNWSTATCKEFKIYHGFGKHEEMLDGDFGKKNVEIIKQIIMG